MYYDQVAPAELEALLCTHPSVQDAAVVGLKVDESVGEVPKAFVVLKPDTDIKTTEIEDFVESKMIRLMCLLTIYATKSYKYA